MGGGGGVHHPPQPEVHSFLCAICVASSALPQSLWPQAQVSAWLGTLHTGPAKQRGTSQLKPPVQVSVFSFLSFFPLSGPKPAATPCKQKIVLKLRPLPWSFLLLEKSPAPSLPMPLSSLPPKGARQGTSTDVPLTSPTASSTVGHSLN